MGKARFGGWASTGGFHCDKPVFCEPRASDGAMIARRLGSTSAEETTDLVWRISHKS